MSRPDKITTPQLLLGGLQTSHVRNTAKVDMYRAAGRKIFPSEVTGFDSAFLNRDFVRSLLQKQTFTSPAVRLPSRLFRGSWIHATQISVDLHELYE